MKLKYLIPLITILFTSCYKQSITIKSDLSGFCKLSLQLDNSAIDFFDTLKSSSSTIDNDLFFFKNEEEIKSDLRQIKNIKIRNVNILENKNFRLFNIDLLFSKYKELPNILLNKYINNKINEERGNLIIRTTINPNIFGNKSNIQKNYEELDVNIKSIIDAFSSIINITLTYSGPSEVIKSISTKKGILTDNNSTIEYSFTLYDILQSKKPIEIITQFKK